jgi:hypothetical protein
MIIASSPGQPISPSSQWLYCMVEIKCADSTNGTPAPKERLHEIELLVPWISSSYRSLAISELVDAFRKCKRGEAVLLLWSCNSRPKNTRLAVTESLLSFRVASGAALFVWLHKMHNPVGLNKWNFQTLKWNLQWIKSLRSDETHHWLTFIVSSRGFKDTRPPMHARYGGAIIFTRAVACLVIINYGISCTI